VQEPVQEKKIRGTRRKLKMRNPKHLHRKLVLVDLLEQNYQSLRMPTELEESQRV
jgi:hypothetical protein